MAEDDRGDNAFANDGRAAKRQFWTAFFVIPDLSRTLDAAVADAVVGDARRLDWVRRRAERTRVVRTVSESPIATINYKEPT